MENFQGYRIIYKVTEVTKVAEVTEVAEVLAF